MVLGDVRTSSQTYTALALSLAQRFRAPASCTLPCAILPSHRHVRKSIDLGPSRTITSTQPQR